MTWYNVVKLAQSLYREAWYGSLSSPTKTPVVNFFQVATPSKTTSIAWKGRLFRRAAKAILEDNEPQRHRGRVDVGWLEHSVQVGEAPIDLVWKLWSDLEQMPHWMKWISSVKVLEENSELSLETQYWRLGIQLAFSFYKWCRTRLFSGNRLMACR